MLKEEIWKYWANFDFIWEILLSPEYYFRLAATGI